MSEATFNGLIIRANSGGFIGATFALDINGDGDFDDVGDIAPTSGFVA